MPDLPWVGVSSEPTNRSLDMRASFVSIGMVLCWWFAQDSIVSRTVQLPRAELSCASKLDCNRKEISDFQEMVNYCTIVVSRGIYAPTLYYKL